MLNYPFRVRVPECGAHTKNSQYNNNNNTSQNRPRKYEKDSQFTTYVSTEERTNLVKFSSEINFKFCHNIGSDMLKKR